MYQVYNGTIADIKKIYPKKVEDKYFIMVETVLGKYYDSDINTYPNRKPYVCETLEQARDYCNMMIEGIEAYESYIERLSLNDHREV